MKPVATGADPWTERYEALRRHVREGRDVLGSEPFGWVVMVRQGMAGWMKRWATPVGQSLSLPASVPWRARAAFPSWQGELTALLAQMTAAYLQPSAQA